jgi:SAM-dependent methyltransferase
MRNDVRCENLEALTFRDSSIDLHVTQDVFEHIFNPEAAFREIARTLCPGGAHIFTVPLVEKERVSRRCASLVSGKIVHLREPEYHGNPISAEGSLVTMRWGYDICDLIAKATGLFTQIVYIDALELGIRAEYIEVLVTRKPRSLDADPPKA